ncbi:hypothetical protein OQA88_8307 [Cercophora sp. LCS_1]
MSTALIPSLLLVFAGGLAALPAVSSRQLGNRLMWQLVQVICAAFALHILPDDFPNLESCLYICTSVITAVLRSVFVLFSQQAYVAAPQPGASLSRWAAWATDTIVSAWDSRVPQYAARGCGKTDQAPNPTPSQHRAKFFVTRAAMIAMIVAVRHMDFELLVSRFGTAADFADFIHPTRRQLLRRLRHVTAREVSIRAWLVVIHNFYASSAMIFPHCVFSILFVNVLRMYEPKEWPHLFGSPAEAYTIGRYWSKFWHRAPVPTYISYAKLVGDKTLPFRRGGQMYRVWVVFFVFACAGLMHAVTLFIVGFRCGWWEQVYWWSLNFAAVMAEQVVFSAARLVIGDKVVSRPTWPARILGYVWVFAFQFWSLPKMYYRTTIFCSPVSTLR